MKKTAFIIIYIFVILIVLIGFEMIRPMMNPLVKSEEMISENILSQLPLGTHMNDVLQFAKNKRKWEIRWVDHENGFVHQRKKDEIIGEKSIRISLGDYYIMSELYFETNVTVLFGFNEQSELIDIWVWKTTDSL